MYSTNEQTKRKNAEQRKHQPASNQYMVIFDLRIPLSENVLKERLARATKNSLVGFCTSARSCYKLCHSIVMERQHFIKESDESHLINVTVNCHH
jgi:hypothetical protein